MEEKFKSYDVKKAIDSLSEGAKIYVRMAVGSIVVSEDVKRSMFGVVKESCDTLLEYLLFIDAKMQERKERKD